MKTWEMIKELTENPHKRFKDKRGHEVFVDKDNFIRLEAGRVSTDLFRKSIEDESWQEIKQSVTWQEAIQAWMGGKSITCEIEDNISKTKFEFTNDIYLTNTRSTPISLGMLQRGQWYID